MYNIEDFSKIFSNKFQIKRVYHLLDRKFQQLEAK